MRTKTTRPGAALRISLLVLAAGAWGAGCASDPDARDAGAADTGRPLDTSLRDTGDTLDADAPDGADASAQDAPSTIDVPAADQSAPDVARDDTAGDDRATLDVAARDAGPDTYAVDAGPDLVVAPIDSGPPLGQWQRSYANDFGGLTATRVRIAPDGSIVLVGYVANTADGRVEGAYAVFDGNGVARLGRRYASPGREMRLRDVRPLADGGAVVVGYDGRAYDENDAVVARLAPDGAVRWARALRSAGVHDSFDGVTVLADGAVVAAGTSEGFNAAAVQSEALLAWFSPDGVALAARAVGGTRNEYGRSVVALADGSLVLAAESDSFVTLGSGRETLLAQLAPLGASVAWARTFAANDVRVAQLERARDGRLLVAQNDLYPSTADRPFSYLDVAADGATHTNVFWTDTTNSGAAVLEATDGTRLAVGGQSVLWLERFGRDGARLAGRYMQPRVTSMFAAGGAATADNGLVAAAGDPLTHQLWLTRADAALAIGGCNDSFPSTRTFTSIRRTATPAVHTSAVLATAALGATALDVTPMAITASLACSAP